MKILYIHNTYREAGGEDIVVEEQIDFFNARGHEVIVYKRSNNEIEKLSLFQRIGFYLKGIYWSSQCLSDIKGLIREKQPDIAVVHNIFYFLSPSIYQACHDENIPIVQCLHTYRWLLDRSNRKCFPEFKLKSVKDIILSRIFVPRILSKIKKSNIFNTKVKQFVCLSDFCKMIYVKNGFDEKKISVVPPSVKVRENAKREGSHTALFIGRLAKYKGIHVLLKAMQSLEGSQLRIIGDGPLKNIVKAAAEKYENIEYLGRLPQESVIDEISKCSFLVFPSLCPETFGKVIIEAFACGVPVIGCRETTAEEIIEDGKTGLLVEKNDSNDLACKMKMLFNDFELVKRMGECAHQVCRKQYSVQKNYEALNALYQEIIQNKENEKINQII